MVSYVRGHNFDRDERTCVRVLAALRASLLRARSDEEGVTHEADDLEPGEQGQRSSQLRETRRGLRREKERDEQMVSSFRGGKH